MRESEFWNALEWVYPDGHGKSLVQDLVLSALGDMSPQAALDAGMPPRRVWEALCDAMDWPEQYRFLNRINSTDRAKLRR
ncbi:MAG: DUF3046 domain-containing protein [Ancrocorticia sp.]|jgi:hypothetical protein|nr:DUF3046 domain-containing protein [Ancrocorticia sp.]MCI1895359.1 DUF3046 domain-containing protein [Ancrocorticia sp.]MCI1932034.1 DUF3046 domain-containing protein [Ancrocorticia sp.]MCI1963395.1 DUF3046 domain-containing protein [Ancrocorticia sp.]MCI2002411.1 DUF3046 domain-containing protein [Ancrocorticia sp.]